MQSFGTGTIADAVVELDDALTTAEAVEFGYLARRSDDLVGCDIVCVDIDDAKVQTRYTAEATREKKDWEIKTRSRRRSRP